MNDAGRKVMDPAEWLREATERSPIPFDNVAFWVRLCDELKTRFVECRDGSGCVDWLTRNVSKVNRKTFERWSQDIRPQVATIKEVCSAINRQAPDGTVALDVLDLLQGLPPHKPRNVAKHRPTEPASADESGWEFHRYGSVSEDLVKPDRESSPHGAELAALTITVKRELARAPALLDALVNKGYGDKEAADRAGSVANAIVDTTTRTLVDNLAEFASKSPLARGVVRTLLWELLPFIVNWRGLVDEARELEAGSALLLPLRTETVAEIVLAGIDWRKCQFISDEAVVPRGELHIPLPPSAYAPFFDLQGEVLADALLFNLYAESGPSGVRALGGDVWVKIQRKFPKYPSFKIAVEVEIRGSPATKLVPYMLVIDEELDPKPIHDVDASWEIAKGSLSKALPGLRLVRLLGGDSELREEMELVKVIKDVRDLE